MGDGGRGMGREGGDDKSSVLFSERRPRYPLILAQTKTESRVPPSQLTPEPGG